MACVAGAVDSETLAQHRLRQPARTFAALIRNSRSVSAVGISILPCEGGTWTGAGEQAPRRGLHRRGRWGALPAFPCRQYSQALQLTLMYLMASFMAMRYPAMMVVGCTLFITSSLARCTRFQGEREGMQCLASSIACLARTHPQQLRGNDDDRGRAVAHLLVLQVSQLHENLGAARVTGVTASRARPAAGVPLASKTAPLPRGAPPPAAAGWWHRRS